MKTFRVLLMTTSLIASSLLMSACSSSSDASKSIDEDMQQRYAGCQIGAGGEDGPGQISGLQAQGIINGTLLREGSAIARSTVMLVSKSPDASGVESTSTCTGVVIAPDLILTAAHCVNLAQGLSPQERGAKTKVLASVDPLCAVIGHKRQDILLDVRATIVHPRYSNYTKENDFALLYMNANMPAPYVPARLALSNQTVTANDTVYIAGYGRTTDVGQTDPDENRLRYGRLRVIDGDETYNLRGQTINSAASSRFLILRNDETSSGCHGDSGGPAMVVGRDGRLSVVGIASFVYNKNYGAFNCRSRLTYGRVSAHADWIRQNSNGRIR